MKILYISNSRIPTEKAHGIQIMKTCESLAELGHSVKLIVPLRFNAIHEDAFDYYNVKNNFTIHKLFCLDLVALGKIGFLIQSLSFAIVSTLYMLFSKDDVIYARDELSLFIISFFKKNIVWEAHDGVWNTFIKRVLTHGKGLVVISNGLKEFYIQKGIPAQKIMIARDGVDLTEFSLTLSKQEAKIELNLTLEKRIILYTGHLYDWKGVDTLAEAAAYLSDDILVLFVGGTPEDLRGFKAKYIQQKNIEVVGKKPHQEMPYYLKAADLLVIPNSAKKDISRLYTSPIKLFEYMASGTPIVASDLPSMREVLNDENAFFAEPDNARSFAEIIVGVINNEQEATKRAVQAKDDVQHFSWQERAKIIIDMLARNE